LHKKECPPPSLFFGEFDKVPHLLWVWMVSLNALVGVACAVWHLRSGSGGTILVRFGAATTLAQRSKRSSKCL
jgi:hypothetical protein